MKRKSGSTSIALSVQLGDERTPPTEFRIFRKGENPSEKGTFLFDDDAAASVMSNYTKRGKALRIDYNHGVTFANPTPDMAIAAGSFVPAVRDGELWATDVSWTTRASTYLREGEYTEFSPLFNHDADGRVLWLRNLALTNLPALDETIPLVAANANEPGDDTMSTEACKSCADKDAKMAALSSEMSDLKTAMAALNAKVAGDADDKKLSAQLRSEVTALTGKADVPEAIGILRAQKTAAESATLLQAEVAKSNEAKLETEFNGLVDEAVTSLRVTPGDKDTFRASFLEGGKVTASAVASLRAFVKWAPARVAAALSQPTPGAVAALSATTVELAKHMGIDPEVFAKSQQAAPAAR